MPRHVSCLPSLWQNLLVNGMQTAWNNISSWHFLLTEYPCKAASLKALWQNLLVSAFRFKAVSGVVAKNTYRRWFIAVSSRSIVAKNTYRLKPHLLSVASQLWGRQADQLSMWQKLLAICSSWQKILIEAIYCGDFYLRSGFFYCGKLCLVFHSK